MANIQVNPYLNFNNQCREAMEFYAEILGGKIESMMTFGDIPDSGQPADMADGILHARLVVGNWVVMASDCPPGFYDKPQGFRVSINVDSIEEAERIFAALSEGGTTVMPMQQTFWAVRFGMADDRFGTPWMVGCEQS